MAKYVTEDNLSRYDVHLKEWATLLQRRASYQVGDIVHKGQNYLKCITTGMTSQNALVFSSTVPGTVLTDGTVEWQIINPFAETLVSNWASGIKYELNQIIIYSSKLYRCTAAHTSSSAFDTTKWTPVYVKSDLSQTAGIKEWTASFDYDVDDIVIFGGSLYRCNNTHTSGSSFQTDQAKWNLVTSDLHYWAASTYYKAGVTVIKGTDVYVCTVANSDSSFNVANWQRLGSVCVYSWYKNTSYLYGSIATVNGLLYWCNTEHTSATSFNDDKDNWTLLYANVVEWQSGTHKQGELVIHNRRLYRALQDHVTAGFLYSYWEEISPTFLDDWLAYTDPSQPSDLPLIYLTFEDRGHPYPANSVGDLEVYMDYTNAAGRIGSNAAFLNFNGNQPRASIISWFWSKDFGTTWTYYPNGYVQSIDITNFQMTFEAWIKEVNYGTEIKIGFFDWEVAKHDNGNYVSYTTDTGIRRNCNYLLGATNVWYHLALEFYVENDKMLINIYKDGVYKTTTNSNPYENHIFTKTWPVVNAVRAADPSFYIETHDSNGARGSLYLDEVRFTPGLKYNKQNYNIPDPIDFVVRSHPYIKHEAVVHDGKLYRCLVDSEVDTIWTPSHWEIVGGTESSTAIIIPYTVDIEYFVGDVVLYNNSLFRCNTSHTGGLNFDATKWDVIFASINTWSQSTVYHVGTTIIYSNKLYRCNTSHTSDATDFANDLSNWDLIGGGSSSGGVTEWAANTLYTEGQILTHSGDLYTVDSDFTSGSTFSDTNLTWYGSTSMTSTEIQDIIDAF